jgi:pimeloyl-ACP methyl ester carboxylesterase
LIALPAANFVRFKITMTRRTTFKGVGVGYTRQGVGDTLVLLHGFLEDAGMWHGFVESYRDRFDIICVELLGNGVSDCTGYLHTMEEHAEAVLAVLEAEQVEKCTMIGHSMGGYVTLAFARKYPEKLAGYGLFFSTAYPDSERKKEDRERAVEAIKKHRDLFVEMTIPRLFNQERLEEFKADVAEYITGAKKQPGQGIVANTRGMKDRLDQTAILRDSKRPVLFIHGNSDPVLPNDLALKQVDGCDHINTLFLDGVGHMGHLEAPELCFPAIAEFIESVTVNG